MYSGLHVKQLMLFINLTKSGISQQHFIKYPMSNFTKIHPVGAELLYVERDTHTDRHDEVKRSFLWLCEHT